MKYLVLLSVLNYLFIFVILINRVECFSFQKSGKWCAMHVRVAWEIYHHQQKQQAEAQKGDSKQADPLRPSGHLIGGLHRPPDLTSASLLGAGKKKKRLSINLRDKRMSKYWKSDRKTISRNLLPSDDSLSFCEIIAILLNWT